MTLFQSRGKRKYFYLLAGVFLFLGAAFWWWDVWGRGYVIFNPQPVKDSSSRYSRWNKARRIFESEGEKLEGWFQDREGAHLLVFCAGRSRNAGDYLKTFDSSPVAKLLVNYRGFGTSTGHPAEEKVVGDMINVIETVLKETGRSWDQVILVGNSLGTGVAAHIAAQRPAGRLILCVPFENFEACAVRFAPKSVVSLLFGGTFSSDLYAPLVKSPVIILAAVHDREIPVEQARRLSRMFEHVRYREFPAGHNSVWGISEFRNELEKGICDSLSDNQPD